MSAFLGGSLLSTVYVTLYFLSLFTQISFLLIFFMYYQLVTGITETWFLYFMLPYIF